MGRKRKAVECSAIAQQDKTSNACSETTSTQEKLHLHTDSSNAMGAMNVENNAPQNSNGIKLEKNSRVKNMVVRRSERLKSSVLPTGSLRVKPVVEHVNLVENEKEEAPHSQQVNTLPVLREKNLEREPQAQQLNTLPVLSEKNLEREPQAQQVNTLPVLSEKNLEREPQAQQVSTLPQVSERSWEEKVDYLVRAVDQFKSKTVRQVFGRPNEGPSADFSYKSLYIASQKKIEALMEENYELVRKLEFTRGKIAAYEAMKDAVGASKEVILVSNLGNAMEATVSLSPQAVQKCSPPPAAAASPDAADGPKQKNSYKKKRAKR